MKITDLQTGQSVRYRKGINWTYNQDNGLKWLEWKQGTLQVQRNNKNEVIAIGVKEDKVDYFVSMDYNTPCDYSTCIVPTGPGESLGPGENHPWGFFFNDYTALEIADLEK